MTAAETETVLAQINKGVEGARAWARRPGVDVRIWDVHHVDILPGSSRKAPDDSGEPA